MPIKISLTQFLTYNATVSTPAKIKCVSKIKNQNAYNPVFDYWKDLRDAIKDCLKNKKPINSLLIVPAHVKADRRANYLSDARKFVEYISKHSVSYFDSPHAYWESADGKLIVSASAEIGLCIDGQNYLLKNYYKKKDKNVKVAAKNIKSTLALMKLSKQKTVTPNSRFAVLNLQNGKLYPDSEVDDLVKLTLNVDANTFVNIWESI